MELSAALLGGSLSGLVSLLAHSVVWSAIHVVRPPKQNAPASYANLDYAEVFLHMFAGAGLGLLFWLSWGLAAIVDVTWWKRGLLFAGLCWLVLALPPLISMTLNGRGSPRAATAIAARWATTCLITGLVCAWSWAQSA
jgi:hypothetical protein